MSYWSSKLTAFLHDPPHKQFDIPNHEVAREPILRHLGITEEEMKGWSKIFDWWASAADRYPFPGARQLVVNWQTDGHLQFHHPLSGTRFTPSQQPRENSAVGEKWLEDSLHGLCFDDAVDRSRFFRLWRFWAERAAREKNDLMAYLPADSRIPDHTIWQHLALCSALDSVHEKKAAFLMMQIGPVQEFIAQSRKMQDLWSGSYLLSYLISKALAAIALEVGADAIIYPNLRGVPLLDWAWSREDGLFPQGTFNLGAGRLHPDELLIPSLPNRFLALVPSGEEGQRIAQLAAQAIREEWKRIADAVHEDICSKLGEPLKSGEFPDWDNIWEAQVARFPSIDYTLHEWEPEAEKIAADGTPPLLNGWEQHPLYHAEKWREILDPSKHSHANIGSLWALHYEMTAWKFAALKNARAFDPWVSTLFSEKDHLNGRDEIIGGRFADAFWTALREAYQGEDRGEFKGQQRYGALTVIKRLWPRCYLGEKLGWKSFKPNFESVPDIAQAIDADSDSEKYYAILCMDGDDMGQWVSGAKAPPLTRALADKATAYFRKHWKGTPEADKIQRPLSPSYHAALSESLGNFGLYAAGQVVEAFHGQLFYAGGDDVLAILPVNYAIECAMALRCAFQGMIPDGTPSAIVEKLNEMFEFPVPEGGFLRCKVGAGRSEKLRPNWPLTVPGPTATVSAGIAIGHVRSPMQGIIQAAREAERAAKSLPGKDALCLRILKRSGESADFTAGFAASATNVEKGSSVWSVWEELNAGIHDLSGRFAYRYLQLLKPLLVRSDAKSDSGWEAKWTSDLIEACQIELQYVLKNQAGQQNEKASHNSARWINTLVGTAENPVLSPTGFLHFWMAWAFLRRISEPST